MFASRLSLPVIWVTRRGAVRPKNCLHSPVSVVFCSIVITAQRIALVFAGPLDNYVLPQIDTPVDVTAVIEIQRGGICGRGIRACECPFEVFDNARITRSCGDLPVRVHRPAWRRQQNDRESASRAPLKRRLAEPPRVFGTRYCLPHLDSRKEC